MNLVGGVVQPDSGTMQFNNQPYAPRNPSDAYQSGIAFIHQELNLFTNLSIAENIFIGGFPRKGFLRSIDRATVRQRTRDLLKAVNLDLSPDLQVERISPGERQLVEIAKALYQDAALIIFDEPTTSLTARETENLFGIMRRLREQGKSLIYISHILNDVRELSDSIAIMRDGELVTQDSARSFDVKLMISLMVGRDIEQLYPPRTSTPSRDEILRVEALTAKGIVDKISFRLHKGEVLGLFGLMGSGRTELARMIFGLDPFDSGQVVVDSQPMTRASARSSIRNHLAFVTENRREEGLLMNIDIANNIGLVSLPTFANAFLQVIDRRELLGSAQQMANALQLKAGNIQEQPAKSLSGGNQQKVVIAKWLLTKPSIFIMDEPTRGIDVGAKYEIYTIIDRLASEGSSVLLISSELEELMGMCDRILVMNRGELVGEFSRGDFDKERILRAAFREMDTASEAAQRAAEMSEGGAAL
jgi:ribose transport system ATP-binding protein